jgi:hypothetical protein
MMYNNEKYSYKHMDLAILQKRVEESRLLTPAEKQYWTQNLPRMSAEQIARLENLLDEADKLPWSPALEQYLTMVSAPNVALSPTA